MQGFIIIIMVSYRIFGFGVWVEGGGGGGERVREGIMEWVWVLVDFDENLDVFGEK